MDKKALKLLCKRCELSPEEEAYCTEKGVLTAIEPMEHDTFIRKIKEAAGAVTHEKAVKGFLYSISTGDFRYRTALSSLIWAEALPEHSCEKVSAYNGRYICGICGGEFSEGNDLSFEDMMARYKTQSEEKIADLKRVTENHRGGYSRRRG